MATRKTLCLCLCALLFMGALPALAAPGDTVLYPREAGEEAPAAYVSSVAIMPDGVYCLVSGDKVTRWRPGDEGPTELFVAEEHHLDTLAPGDDGLYALRLAPLGVARVDDTGYVFSETEPDFPEMERELEGERFSREIFNAFVRGGDLFLLLGGREESDRQTRTLYRVPLDGSPRQEYQVPGLTAVAPWRDDALLAWVADLPNNYWIDLVELNLDTGKPGKTLKAQITDQWSAGGFACAPEEEAVYFLRENQVQRLDMKSGEVRGLAFLPLSGNSRSFTRTGMLAGGYFVTAQFDGVYIRNIDPAFAVERALRIAGGGRDEAYEAFTRAHPEIPVLLLESDYSNVAQIGQAIQGGETEIDIFTVYGFTDPAPLLEKGYAADLSGSEILSAHLAGMYPQVQAHLCDGAGVLRAWPIGFYYWPLVVDMTLFEAYFPGEALPGTWADFLTMYLRFQEDPPEDVAFLDHYVDSEGMASNLLHLFSRQYERDGGVADYESPVLRGLLELAARLPVEGQMAEWGEVTPEDVARLNDYYSRQSIFSTDMTMFENLALRGGQNITVEAAPGGGYYEIRGAGGTSGERTGHDYRLIPWPVFEEGQKPEIRAEMPLLIVNPKSSNLELAMQYLENLPAYQDTYLRYALQTNLTEPVMSPYYYDALENAEKNIAELEEALPGMDEAERRKAEETIAGLENYKREVEGHPEEWWEISPEALAQYREMAPYITLQRDGIFHYDGSEGSRQVYELLERYQAGLIDLEAFLKELNGKARMIRNEQM